MQPMPQPLSPQHTVRTGGMLPIFDMLINDARDAWCVYAHMVMDKDCGQPMNNDNIVWYVQFIGVCRFTDIVSPTDCRKNNEWHKRVAPFIIRTQVLALGTEQACFLHASKERAKYNPPCNMHGYQSTRGQRVRCITTGEEFANMTQAAQHYGMSISALSNHLNGRKGYENPHGMKFERIL